MSSEKQAVEAITQGFIDGCKLYDIDIHENFDLVNNLMKEATLNLKGEL